jgi:transposase
MPRTRTAYPTEFRDQIIALARAGRSVEDLAKEFEPCSHTIRGWLRAADAASVGRLNSSTTVLSDDEREELRKLRREVRQLRQERDILSKAAAWFAQNDVTSTRSSN